MFMSPACRQDLKLKILVEDTRIYKNQAWN